MGGNEPSKPCNTECTKYSHTGAVQRVVKIKRTKEEARLAHAAAQRRYDERRREKNRESWRDEQREKKRPRKWKWGKSQIMEAIIELSRLKSCTPPADLLGDDASVRRSDRQRK